MTATLLGQSAYNDALANQRVRSLRILGIAGKTGSMQCDPGGLKATLLRIICQMIPRAPIRSEARKTLPGMNPVYLGGNRREGRIKVKPIKMFGLAALAALMAMAFVGAGSAMAESTELCTEDPGTGATATCPFGEPVTNIHETSVGKAKLLASPEVQCNVLFESTNVGAAGAPQVIEGHFTYTNCGCTVKEKAGTTAKINVLREGHETASVTGEAEIIVTCFGIECTYKGTGLKGTAKGPLLSTEANGEINLSEQEVSGKGTFCPSKGKLDIKTTALHPSYIGKAGAKHYCVEYEHLHGLYEKDKCFGLLSTPTGHYELVVGPVGRSPHEIVCVRIRHLPYIGLWKDSACTEDDKELASKYEKALILLE